MWGLGWHNYPQSWLSKRNAKEHRLRVTKEHVCIHMCIHMNAKIPHTNEGMFHGILCYLDKIGGGWGGPTIP